MKRIPLFLAPLWLFAAVVTAAAAPSPLTIFVSVLPQKFFAERIAGDNGRVLVMVGPGKSPATYEPTSKQMALLGEARLYFSVGVPFEQVWLPKIGAANRAMEIVATGHDPPQGEEAAGGQNGGRGHGAEDPHVWTSPLAAVEMARSMARALMEADGENAGAYEQRLEGLVADLENLDREIARITAPLPRRTFFVFHPSWGAFADAYGLEQVAIEQGGGEPGARYLARLIERARREKITVIFAQPQFDRRNAETVSRAIGGRVVIVDPLAEDYMTNIKAAAEAFAEALR